MHIPIVTILLTSSKIKIIDLLTVVSLIVSSNS